MFLQSFGCYLKQLIHKAFTSELTDSVSNPYRLIINETEALFE